jgi:hypothetical protein
MHLTEQELKQFDEDGYVVKPQVFSEEDLKPLREAMSEIVATEAARLKSEGKLSETFHDEPFQRRLACIFKESPEAGQEIYQKIIGKGGGGYSGEAIFKMMVHPPLLACIESIVGPDIVASSVYRIRPKMPKHLGTEVPWHQDSGYFMEHCDAQMIVTCWVPLVDATVENGCLWVQPKSHKNGIIRHHTRPNAGYLVIADEDLPEIESFPVEMKAGDVLLMTNITPHCSKENNTDDVRWSFDLRYQNMNVPNNVGEPPETFDPNRAPVEMACHPPEADFIVRCASDPQREIHDPAEFHRMRDSYQNANNIIGYARREWTPLLENAIPSP